MSKEEKKEEIKEEEKVEKAEEKTITEEDLLKAIESLEEFAKANDEEEEEIDEKEDEEEEDEEEEEEEKSFSGNFGEDETLEKAIEVSPFLEALVGSTELSLNALGKEITKLKKSQEGFDFKHIDTLKQVADVVKSLTSKIDEVFKGMDERLKRIEGSPLRPLKSITKAAVIEKSFAGKDGSEESIATLPKRKVVDAISKAVDDGKIKDSVLFAYEAEGSYPFTDEQQNIIKSYV